jgi:hypothetical protein
MGGVTARESTEDRRSNEIVCAICEDRLCPSSEQPFFPLMYLGPEILQELYPYIKAAQAESFGTDRTSEEYSLLLTSTRAWLQHYGVFLD